MSDSSIEWTDVTDNIIAAVDEHGGQRGWWCRKISPECLNCYAEVLNQSDYFNGNKLRYAGEPPVLKLREDIIDGWARQRKSRKHFVASMTDVFGEWVPQSWIFRFLDGMWRAPLQIFQVLTKRAANMRVFENDGVEWRRDHQPDTAAVIEFRLAHRKGGEPLEWPEDLRVRQMPGAA